MIKGGQQQQQKDLLNVKHPTGFASPPQVNKPQNEAPMLHPSQLLDNRTKKRVPNQPEDHQRDQVIPEQIETGL